MIAMLHRLLSHGIGTIPADELRQLPSGTDEPLRRVESEVEQQLSQLMTKRFGQSLHIRHLDSGSSNGCEWEITALMNPVYDLQRFGMDFVASPRHADLLLVTGGMTRNLEEAVRKTYEATPAPKMVVAVGACACTGGVIGQTYAHHGNLADIIPISVYVPGCPPRPQAILAGILQALQREREIEGKAKKGAK